MMPAIVLRVDRREQGPSLLPCATAEVGGRQTLLAVVDRRAGRAGAKAAGQAVRAGRRRQQRAAPPRDTAGAGEHAARSRRRCGGADNKEAYLGRHGKLRDFDVRPITETEGDVVGYAVEQVARNPASVDDILVLSKAASELIRRSELQRG
jgi:hypothetical protein